MTITNKVSLKSVMAGNAPIPDVPDAPTIGAISDPGTDGYASVAFTAAATGGAVTTFTATSTPDSITGTSATSPITVTGLTLNTAYTFKVKGTNSTATGPESSASSSFTPTSHNSYESIATITVGSTAQAAIEFTSIPQTYKHLQIRSVSRKDGSQTGAPGMQMIFNGDDNESYNSHYLQFGFYNTVSDAYSSNVARANMNAMYSAGGGQTANVFAPGIFDILDYTNTSKYKTVRSITGPSSNVNASDLDYIILGGGLWRSTSAINSIKISLNNFVQHSQFALYGIKG